MVKTVVALAFDGVQVLDVTGPLEVFSCANQFSDKPEYRVACVSPRAGLTQTSGGVAIAPTHYQNWRGKIDTLVVPGASEKELSALRNNAPFISWLKRRLRSSRRIVSVCTGAFVLAELGFLDGRRASTHWAACSRLRAFSPSIEVDEDAIYTKDGNVYTSAGVTSGIDLALHLVEEDIGRDISLAIARNLVLYLRRPGGQSQYSAPLALQSVSESRTDRILSYVDNNPQADLSVETLAERFAMSARHLTRLFKAATGTSPAKYVANSRLLSVRQHLEGTRLNLNQIATQCGYVSADTMGRLFRKEYGVAPSDYRARFR